MKNSISAVGFLSCVIGAAFASGCSTFSGHESGKDLAANGPTIVNPRSMPSTIQMNASLQPTQNPDILADVKDFTGKVADVKIRFVNVPLEIPMENVGGSTWQATLSPQQLQMLAVSGKTITYQANIFAKDDQGVTTQTQKPFDVAIESPEVVKNSS